MHFKKQTNQPTKFKVYVSAGVCRGRVLGPPGSGASSTCEPPDTGAGEGTQGPLTEQLLPFPAELALQSPVVDFTNS